MGETMERDERDVVISSHALERYRIVEPNAFVQDVIKAVTQGTGVEIALARTLAGRPVDSASWIDQDIYLLSPCKRGMFVAREERGCLAVITFLRFGPSQQIFVEEHWGADYRPPTVEAAQKQLNNAQVKKWELIQQNRHEDDYLVKKLTYPVLGQGTLRVLSVAKGAVVQTAQGSKDRLRLAFARAVTQEKNRSVFFSNLNGGKMHKIELGPEHGLPRTKEIFVLTSHSGGGAWLGRESDFESYRSAPEKELLFPTPLKQ